MTKDEILKYVIYDKDQAIFIWKDHWCNKVRKRLVGKKAGCHYLNHGNKYSQLRINNTVFPCHHLVWLMENNELPNGIVDHIDGNSLNNHISNLRLTNDRLNSINKERHRKGKLPGASYNKRRKKWQSQIQIGKKNIFLGRFKTEQEAHSRYCKELLNRGLL